MADAVHDTRVSVSQTTADPSRRTILAGLPAAAASVTALASPALAGSPHPDAALLALEPDLNALKAQCKITHDGLQAADAAFVAECNRLPLARRHRLGAFDRLETKHKLNLAEEESDEAARRLAEPLDKLSATRATTLDGLKLKARWAEEDDDIPLSIVDDLRAM
jgi:hypothetical protein